MLMSRYEKIFVVGRNKTGTTSLHNLFQALGFKSLHSEDWMSSNKLTEFDAFSDGHVFIEDVLRFQKLFPKSLFILNTRPIKNWIVSRFNQGATNPNPEEGYRNWCWPPTKELAKSWIIDREAFHEGLTRVFKKAQDSLIVVNIERDGWESFVARRLGLKVAGESHVNITNRHLVPPEEASLIQQVTKEALAELNYPPDEVFLKNDSIKNHSFEHNLF